MKQYTLRAHICMAAVLVCSWIARGAASLETAAGVSLTVDEATGAYQIKLKDPAWTFGGRIGTALSNVAVNKGQDRIGTYQEIAFGWKDTVAMAGGIRVYEDRPVVLFKQTCLSASRTVPAPFPKLTALPRGLHHFSYKNVTFATPTFSLEETGTPWLLFDDKADALIVSPAANFMCTKMTGDGSTSIVSDFNDELADLPAHFTQQTLLVAGRGINQTWDVWGQALTDLAGKTRPANDGDIGTKYYGYWTDNGGKYYYNYDASKGYAGTLLALVAHYRKEAIPIRYLQLDSWWYYKSLTDPKGKTGKPKNPKLPEGEWNRYGGLLEYTAHKDLFPEGLAAFQKKIGLPFITHNRWVDLRSPYHKKYRISGVGAVDPKWWDDVADYIKSCGIATYEQDWLNVIYNNSPEMGRTVHAGDAFMDNMARACRERGITLQYCMGLPRHYLEGSSYDNLTTVRASGDRFDRKKWGHFLYTSRLARSIGAWPWTDVYMSTETDNLLLSVLSAGMVGNGDLIAAESKPNIMKAVRADGVIIKPDWPIVPADQSYIADVNKEKRPLVAWTSTDHSSLRTVYVFACTRNKGEDEVRFAPAAFAMPGDVCVQRVHDRTFHLVKAGQTFTDRLGGRDSAYYILAPLTRSGIAFFGDAAKFVSTGKKRIAAITDEPDRMIVTVTFAAGENTVTLHGWAGFAPKGAAYDPATKRFTIDVAASGQTTTENPGGDSIRQTTVVLGK